MADTPLHLHPSVVHLMGTEHWPKGLVHMGRKWALPGSPACSHDYEPTAHSIISLAAVRALCQHGDVCSIDFGPCNDPAKGEFYATVFGHEKYGETPAWSYYAPTEPLAILAAYQATVMGKESSK